jgi:ABC-type phosphate/phosphonate transport system substrate-binding protein
MEGSRLKDLEKRIEHLEYRVRLLAQTADFEKYPFIYTVLESDLTESQVRAIFDLMDKVSKTIRDGKPISHHKFEESIYEIVPSRRGDYHFAEDIVSTLNDEGRWVEVYRHMKKDGMNI